MQNALPSRGAGNGFEKSDYARASHNLYRCPSRHASEEPSRGQQYALKERKHIPALQRARPGIIIEIRWRPAHKGLEGNKKPDKWATAEAEA